MNGRAYKKPVSMAFSQPSSRTERRIIRLLPYGALLFFMAALLWPLCLGRALYWGDILLYFEPMLRFAQDRLREGRLPLWNPYVLCGQPFLGNPQMAIFYPTTVLLFFLPVWLFLSVNSAFHIFLCGAFSYRYFRQWTPGRTAALAGALVYMGSACLVARLQFPTMVQTAAYFPLLLWRIDACLERGTVGRLLSLAVVVALLILAAHAHFAFLILLCGAVYIIGRLRSQVFGYSGIRVFRYSGIQVFRPTERGGMERRRVGALGGAVVLGLWLTAAMALPALQLLRESPRENLTAAQTDRFRLEPEQLWTLLAPRFLGHPASADYWGMGNAWEPALFVGWVPLVCVGYAVWRQWRERAVRFWFLVAMLGLWLALGREGGLYWIAFYAVPGLSKFNDPARFLLLTTFAFAALTTLAMNRWQGKWTRPQGALALLAVALPLWWYGQDWNPTTAPENLRYVPTSVRSLPVRAARQGTGRLHLPEQVSLWKETITEGYDDYGETDARRVAVFLELFLPNLNMRYGIEGAFGYEPVPVYWPTALDGLGRNAAKRGEPNFSRIAGLLNVEAAAFPGDTRYADPRLVPVTKTGSPLRVLQNRDALPRAWIVRRVRCVDGKMRVAAALASPDFQPSQEAIVSDLTPRPPSLKGRGRAEGVASDGSAGALLQPAFLSGREAVALRARSECETEIWADAGETPGFLVYAATAYPGWKAEVDGLSVLPVRTNGACMGVFLSPGTHRVRFYYAPEVFRAGLYLSLLACGVVAAGLCYAHRRRRQEFIRN